MTGSSAGPAAARAATEFSDERTRSSGEVPIRVVLPAHLRNLAGIGGEISLPVAGEPTLRAVLDSLEATYPVLCGTVRDQTTLRRRAFVRFFACEQDLSHDSPDDRLPAPVVSGHEPLLIVGAMAGG
jgi:sulfur-carrier protein